MGVFPERGFWVTKHKRHVQVWETACLNCVCGLRPDCCDTLPVRL